MDVGEKASEYDFALQNPFFGSQKSCTFCAQEALLLCEAFCKKGYAKTSFTKTWKYAILAARKSEKALCSC